MIVYGFSISALALFTMLNLNLGVSYGYVAMLRVFQAAGLAFLFIPINTLAYVGIPMTKNNDVSGLTNLARNIGGSSGTAFLVTMLARRQQFHQNQLGAVCAFADQQRPRKLRWTRWATGLVQHGGLLPLVRSPKGERCARRGASKTSSSASAPCWRISMSSRCCPSRCC